MCGVKPCSLVDVDALLFERLDEGLSELGQLGAVEEVDEGVGVAGDREAADAGDLALDLVVVAGDLAQRFEHLRVELALVVDLVGLAHVGQRQVQLGPGERGRGVVEHDVVARASPSGTP
jgi:hypothetical protein